jgi:hypothetical protein
MFAGAAGADYNQQAVYQRCRKAGFANMGSANTARPALQWSEEDFKTRMSQRAAELGLSLTALLEKAGLDASALSRVPVQGRRLDTFLKLAEACEWGLAEVLGLSLAGPVERDLLQAAYRAATRVMQQVEPAARDEARLVRFQAQIYDRLVHRRRRGETIGDELLRAYEEMLIATWTAN